MKKLILFIGCAVTTFSAWSQVTITNINPPGAPKGAEVVITGTGFSLTETENKVHFQGSSVDAVVTVSTETSITTTVPSDAVTGPVIVVVNGMDSGPGPIFYLPPVITNFDPVTGNVGTQVTINGANFSSISSENEVRFGPVLATVTFSNANQIITSVPAGAVTDKISIKIAGLGTNTTTQFFIGASGTTPPKVEANLTPLTITPNTDAIVKAQFTSNTGSGFSSTKIYYRPITGTSDGEFIIADMLLGGPDTYEFTVPANGVEELGIEYKFVIKDGLGISNTAADQSLKTVRINYPDGLPITSYPAFAAGTTQSSYRIIAIPLVLEKSKVQEVFEELGAKDPSLWRLFNYNGSSFDELLGTSQIRPGEGYWLISKNAVTLNTGKGTSVDVSSEDEFILTLKPGWNQIGNPYNFSIAWADVIAANPTNATFLGGNNSQFRVFKGTLENVETLEPFEGGFVRFTGTTNTNIIIPVKKNESIQSGRVSRNHVTQNSLEQPAWEIALNLKSGNAENKFGGLGMHPEASDALDYQDDFTNPRFMEYLEITFPKKYAGMTYTKDIVSTQENYIWQFEVESNTQANEITMSWDNTHFGNTKTIYLQDLATLRLINMNLVSTYAFDKSLSKNFKVIFGEDQFVKENSNPAQTVLFDPYPNPSQNQRVSIEYAVPEGVNGSTPSLEIFNSIGQRIVTATLSSSPGYSVWHWENEPQQSGTYFVKLKVGSQVLVKKIVKH